MEHKKSGNPRKTTLDKILSTVEHGFADLEAKMERGFSAVAEDIGEIRTDITSMKTDIADLKTEMMEQFDHVDTKFRETNSRIHDLASEVAFRRSIERLEEQGASTAGFAKEIDLALERIGALERHLGIKPKHV
jgi:predicted RNase H-like nuclease (RuvC/YqgF family)